LQEEEDVGIGGDDDEYFEEEEEEEEDEEEEVKDTQVLRGKKGSGNFVHLQFLFCSPRKRE